MIRETGVRMFKCSNQQDLMWPYRRNAPQRILGPTYRTWTLLQRKNLGFSWILGHRQRPKGCFSGGKIHLYQFSAIAEGQYKTLRKLQTFPCRRTLGIAEPR